MRLGKNMEQNTIGGTAFKFSAIGLEHLAATEYTLVTIAVDVTGSVSGFESELRKCLVTAVESCKKSPRSNNLLLRVILFSTSLPGGIEEVHGFKPLSEIDPNAYPNLVPGGMTPLCDAAFSAVGATNEYGKDLMDQDYLANGIVFVITDGCDNDSKTTADMVKMEIEKGVKGETIESIIGIVIGVNAKQYKQELQDFSDGTSMRYLDAGDATPQKLAKLADFVSKSVSSQSQAMGTGGPSQNISATI